MTVKSELTRQREKETWTQVRIELALMREVDKIVESVHVFGARKYFSRSDFAKEAVLKLLREYEAQGVLTPGHNRGKKGKEEEILIARK